MGITSILHINICLNERTLLNFLEIAFPISLLNRIRGVSLTY